MRGNGVDTPWSAAAGIVWPALPGPRDLPLFALAYQLEQSQWWPAEVLRARQLRQVEPLLRHAARQVPFYRSRLAAVAEVSPGGLTPERWRALAPLRRADLQEARESLLARALPRGHGRRVEHTTSGSTGRPIRVASTTLAQQYRRVLRLRGNVWHRRDLAGRLAAIQRVTPALARVQAADGDASWAAGYRTGPYWIRDIGGPLDDHLDWLAEKNPDYLLTYATFARALAERAAERGLRLSRLREVNTMGEVLDAGVREVCRRAWDAPVVDQYAAQETGPVALQCPEHEHYHVMAESVLLEVLDDAGEPCPPGRIGRVVITALHNFAMPLIRYEIGDYAELGDPCPCGRGLPVLTRIMGRARNMVTLPSGERTWARISGEPLTRIAPLRRMQMVQRRRDEIELHLVTTRPLDAAEEGALRAAATAALGHPFALRLVYVDDIALSAGGKFEDFRSEIGG
ncbi:MAG: phenylacetate--CoA ligase family protein [Alphaproteobacteria bacterium]